MALELPRSIGRFLVLAKLGSGGMGMVYAAYDPELDRKVAIKVLRPRRNATTRAAALRIEAEAQAMARLAHPNVVTVFEIDQIGDRPFVAMELVEGSTLRQWLGERPRTWREIVKIFVAAGHGLVAAHAVGLVHCDFKPDNVLIGRDARPRVSDFGLARNFADDEVLQPEPASPGFELTTHRRASGTPGYMSPEQWAGQPLDGRSDQFSFCVALWEALYSSRPFRGSDTVKLRAATVAAAVDVPDRRVRIPRPLLAAVRRGLDADRNQRWASMDELLEALGRAARPRRGWLAAAAALLIACGVAIFVNASHGSELPTVLRSSVPTACGKRDQITTVWNPSARTRYLSGAPNAGTAQEDAGWFDWYARALETEYAASCGHADTRRIACLDDAVDDLRAAVERNEREYWPRLYALDRCGTNLREIDVAVGVDGPDELLSIDGRQVLVRSETGKQVIRELGSGRGMTFDLELPLRWLPDGAVAGEDHHRIVVVDPASNRIVRVFAAMPSDARALDVAPDLRHAALLAGGELSIVPVAGGPPRLDPIAATRYAYTSFSPDSRRLAIWDPDRIYIDDLVSRHRETLAFRLHLRGIGLQLLCWLDATSFTLTGSASSESAGDIWRIRVEPTGHLKEPPQVIQRAERDVSLLVVDAQAKRLLIRRIGLLDQTVLVEDGASVPLPGSVARMYAMAVDRTRGRVLAATSRSEMSWAWMSADGSSVEQIPALDRLRGAVVTSPGLAALDFRTEPPVYVVLDATGASQVRTPIEAARGAKPALRCGTSRCAVRWSIQHTEFIARTEHGTLGAPVRLDQLGLGDVQASWDLAPDGKQVVFVTALAGSSGAPAALVLYDLDSKVVHRTVSTTLRKIQQVRFGPEGNLLLSGISLQGDFVLVRRDATGRERVLLHSESWISGFLPLDDSRVLVHSVSYQYKVKLFETR